MQGGRFYGKNYEDQAEKIVVEVCGMEQKQKMQIIHLREQGCSYAEIAQRVGVSRDTVKTVCRRNSINPVEKDEPVAGICKRCGKPIERGRYTKNSLFCSDACRLTWWKENPTQMARTAFYTFICAGCGKEFTAYGNAHRKYCSHACYIATRFGGERNE